MNRVYSHTCEIVSVTYLRVTAAWKAAESMKQWLKCLSHCQRAGERSCACAHARYKQNTEPPMKTLLHSTTNGQKLHRAALILG